MKKIHIGMLKIFHFINFIVKRTTSEIEGFEVIDILAYVQDQPQCIGMKLKDQTNSGWSCCQTIGIDLLRSFSALLKRINVIFFVGQLQCFIIKARKKIIRKNFIL